MKEPRRLSVGIEARASVAHNVRDIGATTAPAGAAAPTLRVQR